MINLSTSSNNLENVTHKFQCERGTYIRIKQQNLAILVKEHNKAY